MLSGKGGERRAKEEEEARRRSDERGGALTRPIFADVYRFLGLSWETSPQTDSTPEASKHSGSRRIEFSSKSTTFLM